MRLKKTSIFIYLFLPILILISVYFYNSTNQTYSQLVSGTILGTHIELIAVSHTPSEYTVFVKYKYTFNNKVYEKTEYTKGYYKENDAKKELSKYKIGSSICVVAHPDEYINFTSIKESKVKDYFIGLLLLSSIIYLIILFCIFIIRKIKGITG